MSASLARDRLAKILGMLGSSHDGEILAAARQAHSFVSAAGLSWAEVIFPPENDLYQQALESLLIENEQLRLEIARRKTLPPWQAPESLDEALALCELWRPHLTDWDNKFLDSVVGRNRLTRKQINVVRDIVGKISRFARS